MLNLRWPLGPDPLPAGLRWDYGDTSPSLPFCLGALSTDAPDPKDRGRKNPRFLFPIYQSYAIVLFSVRRGRQAGGQARQAWSTKGRRRSRAGSRRMGGSCGGGRIFARLREGWAYDEIASYERLTAERPGGWGGLKKFRAYGSAQALEKARFGQGNPKRKSKGFLSKPAPAALKPAKCTRLAPGPCCRPGLGLRGVPFLDGTGLSPPFSGERLGEEQAAVA